MELERLTWYGDNVKPREDNFFCSCCGKQIEEWLPIIIEHPVSRKQLRFFRGHYFTHIEQISAYLKSVMPAENENLFTGVKQ